jgi:hypothetical protein
MPETLNGPYDWTKPAEALAKIKESIVKAMNKEEKWYSDMRAVHAYSTRFLRFLAICLFAFGTIYPIFAKGENLEWGYVCLAIGSLLLIIDKFFGISSSFVRFYLAELEIQRHTHEFVENWEIEMVRTWFKNFGKQCQAPSLLKQQRGLLNFKHKSESYRNCLRLRKVNIKLQTFPL